MLGTTFIGNTLQPPRWLADFSGREYLEPYPVLLDAVQFTDQGGVPVSVTANAAQGATSLTVSAVQPSLYPATTIIASGNTVIPAGVTLSFGGAKFARTNAPVAVGATTISVDAIPTALVAGDATTYNPRGTETIGSGTIVGRTFTERATNTAWGPAATSDDEIRLTYNDVLDARRNGSVTVVRPGARIKENYLPGYATVLNPSGSPSAMLTKIRGIYDCIIGTD